MADAETAKPSESASRDASENDGTLLAVEATEPVVLLEPDRFADTVDPATALPAQKPAQRQSRLLALVIGGAILAGAGFGAAKYLSSGTASIAALAALQTQVDAQKATDLAIKADLAALFAIPAPDTTALDGRVAALEGVNADISAFAARLATLEDRLLAIEAASVRGEGAPAAALAAMGLEIKALKSKIDTQKAVMPAVTAEIEAASAAAQARLDTAEANAEAAAKQAALSHIRAAFESGAPLGPALESLRSMGADIPAALATETGMVPTLLSLQDSFAVPARAALDAAIRADMGDGWANRLTSFLRSQSGARSLTPQEGTDPDAVLSRAEAALKAGQISQALAELAGLPPVGMEAMAPWMADATRRIDTEQAISDLSATLNGQ